MADTVTTYYGWVKPEPGGSKTTWGVKWNDNLTNIDAIVKGVSDLAGAALPKAGGTLTGQVVAPVPTGLDNLVTVRWIQQLLQLVAPIGQIVLWSGLPGTIPAGWSLCDGGTYNGVLTPNMGGRFPLAVGAAYTSIGDMGGGWLYTPTGSVGYHVLTTNEIPSHVHAAVSTPSLAITPNPHQHLYYRPNYGSGNIYAGGSAGVFSPSEGQQWSDLTSLSVYGSVATTIYAAGGDYSHNHSWTGNQMTIVPMYITMAYIMRTSWPWAPL